MSKLKPFFAAQKIALVAMGRLLFPVGEIFTTSCCQHWDSSIHFAYFQLTKFTREQSEHNDSHAKAGSTKQISSPKVILFLQVRGSNDDQRSKIGEPCICQNCNPAEKKSTHQ